MTFTFDTYSWWGIYWFPTLMGSLALLLAIALPYLKWPIKHIYPPTVDPSAARADLRKGCIIFSLLVGFMCAVMAGMFTVITPDHLRPGDPTDITAQVAEVKLSASEIQPDKLCYTLEGQTSCLDRDDVPAELSLDEPALLLNIEGTQVIVSPDASNEQIEARVASALDIRNKNTERFHLLER